MPTARPPARGAKRDCWAGRAPPHPQLWARRCATRTKQGGGQSPNAPDVMVHPQGCNGGSCRPANRGQPKSLPNREGTREPSSSSPLRHPLWVGQHSNPGGALWAPAAILSSCLSQRRGFFLSQFTSGEDRFCTETAVKKQREQQDQPRSPPRRSHEAWSCSVPCRYHSPQHEEPGLRGKHIARETIRLVHHAFSCHFYSLGILLLRKICMKIESLFPKN